MRNIQWNRVVGDNIKYLSAFLSVCLMPFVSSEMRVGYVSDVVFCLHRRFRRCTFCLMCLLKVELKFIRYDMITIV